jgi:hypothetical protein
LLFDYLLNWVDPRLEKRTAGSPLLLSPKPFLGAKISKAPISKERALMATSTESSGENLFKVCIDGFLLPCKLHQILQLLGKQQSLDQGAKCYCTLEVEETTISNEPSEICIKRLEYSGNSFMIS